MQTFIAKDGSVFHIDWSEGGDAQVTCSCGCDDIYIDFDYAPAKCPACGKEFQGMLVPTVDFVIDDRYVGTV